jgi:dipeptidyl-peptidase-4
MSTDIRADPVADQPDTFPRQYARTQRLTLGEPRGFVVSPDGQRVAYLQSETSDDPVHSLWVLDVATGTPRRVADPRQLLGDDASNENLPAAERARRERTREGGAGVVAFATDDAVTVASFALGGELFVAGLLSAQARPLGVTGPVFDPRPSPTAARVAYVSDHALYTCELDGTTRCLAAEPGYRWGEAEFIAAEEMGRGRGYWWAPDGSAIAATRVDERAVNRWWIGDPANPATEAVEHRYPAAGTTNATVELAIIGSDAIPRWVEWDHATYEYLVDVGWKNERELTLVVQSRDQRRLCWMVVDQAGGPASVVFEDRDDQWVEIVAGGWGWLEDGRLVCCADRDGRRALLVQGEPVTPVDQQVRSVIRVTKQEVVFTANPIDEPSQLHVWRWNQDDGAVALTSGESVNNAAVGGPTMVMRQSNLVEATASFSILGGAKIESRAAAALVDPQPRLLRLGPDRLQAVLLLPHDGGAGPLPVLLDPYGGPHALRATASRPAHCSSQWFADQGFAGLVVDGRGTPGRGHAWERAVHRDLATGVLDDQVVALQAAAEIEPRLDLSRVAIRGWSFGGYLAALAVLRRPDVFHAAIAGAPVTEWRLYDTHYTERYLGDPTADPGPYDLSSVLNLPATAVPATERPLLLIHGLADDNVVGAHTLQLSSHLLAAGRSHNVLPLSGVTHMTPQEVVAENLLRLQLRFLQTSLGLAG